MNTNYLSDQISSLSKPCYYHIRQRRCIRPYLQLDYCNSLYNNLPESQMTHFQQIQNSLVCDVVKAPKYCHTTLSHALFTHSLLRLTNEGRSDLHVERSSACDQITSMSQSWSAMTCFWQFSVVDVSMACQRSAITSGRSTSFICSPTESLVLKSTSWQCCQVNVSWSVV